MSPPLCAIGTSLFAEAVELYRIGTPWWPDKDFEKKYMQPEQASRYEEDAWEEAIAKYLGRTDKCELTIGQLAKDALEIQTQRVGTADQRRIAAVLTRLGWERQPQHWDGRRLWKKKK